MALQPFNPFTSVVSSRDVYRETDEANGMLVTAQQLLSETEVEHQQLTQAANSALDQEDALREANRQEVEALQALISLVSRAVAVKRENVETLSSRQAKIIKKVTTRGSNLLSETYRVYEGQFRGQKESMGFSVTLARQEIRTAEMREKARLQAIFDGNRPVTQETPSNSVPVITPPVIHPIRPHLSPSDSMRHAIETCLPYYVAFRNSLPQVEAAALQQIALRD